MTEPSEKLLQRLAERKRLQEQLEATKPVQFDSDLVPQDEYKRTEGEIELDNFIERITIVQAYERWCGKTRISIRPGQTESIKLRCPNPSHTDEEPSYWINTDKNTGNCGVCGVGYDAKDIAAFRFGYPVPDYKTNGDFPKLIEDMAGDFGFTVNRTLSGEKVLVDTSVDKSDISDISPSAPETSDPETSGSSSSLSSNPVEEEPKSPEVSTDAPVADLYEDEPGYEVTFPTLDWRDLVPGADTFIDRYMEACVKDEVPEEYHFFNALLALGFAAGRKVRLQGKLPVYGNLFLCALGKSGAGKSTAERHLRRLLRKTLPYRASDPTNNGVNVVTPSSAEMLIKCFQRTMSDPIDPTKSYPLPVKGLIAYSELSGLIGRGARPTNILKPVMMDFYDMSDEVRTQSLSSGTMVAVEPFASCSTTAQPAALRDLLRQGDDASGFLNRWLFVGGAPKKRTIMGTGPVDLDAAAESFEKVIGWTASFKADDLVTWEPDALEVMQHFFDTTVYPLNDRADTNIFVRLDLLMMKLALLLSVNLMQRTIQLDVVHRVIKMYPYLMACFGATADQLGNTLEHEMTEAIIFQMRRLGGKEGATLNAIALALKRRKYPKEMILRNIKALIDLGFVEERKAPAGKAGRPTVRYAYVA